MKIGIVGCAGTGKSVLGRRLGEELGIEFLPSKDITVDILNRDGYDYASGQPVEKFLASEEHQMEILRRTKKQCDLDYFITDRTAIDLAAYAIVEMDNQEKVRKYLEECRKMASIYTHLIFCPWEDREIEDNKKRTIDLWYQFTVHSVQLSVMDMFSIEPLVMHHSDVEDRVEIVKHFFDICSLKKGASNDQQGSED